VFEVPASYSRNTRGTPVQNIIRLEPRERVQAIQSVSSLMEDTYLVMATRLGKIKRMHVSQLANLRRNGLNAMKLMAGDELVSVVLADREEDIIMVSELGIAIRFRSAEVTPRQRAAGGMRGMTLGPKDRLVATDVAGPEGLLLIVSQKGYAKQSELRHYRRQRRGGKGLITLKITRKNGPITAAQVVLDETELYLLTERAMIQDIHLTNIRTTYRNTQGVIAMKLQPRDRVTAIRALTPRRTPSKTLNAVQAAAVTVDTSERSSGDEGLSVDGDLTGTERTGSSLTEEESD